MQTHRPLPISIDSAVRLIANGDSRLLRVVDRLAGLALLAAPAFGIGTATAFGLFDAKSELFRLTRDFLGSARSQAMKRRGYSRSEILLAAHTITVIAAFFQAAEEELGKSYRSFEITDDEKVHLANRAAQSTDRTRRDLEALASLKVPAPVSHRSFDVTLEACVEFYKTMGRLFHEFLQGLRSWERLRGNSQERVEQALKGKIPQRAAKIYSANYLHLAADFPEFFVWGNLQEHMATRKFLTQQLDSKVAKPLQELSATFESLNTSLLGVEQLLSTLIPKQIRPKEDWAQQLRRIYEAVLYRPLITGIEGDDTEGVSVPSLAQAYVNPHYRICEATHDSRVAEESWWNGHPVHEDIQTFLLGHLLNASSTYTPMLLLGHPGSGKSLLTQVLAARLPNNLYVAVRVELRKVSGDASVQLQIEHQLEQTIGQRELWPELRSQLSDECLPVVLLDGFDELLQATGATQSDYLERVKEFQEREATLGRPIIAIVTSRTVVADKARIPQGSTVVKLEEFDESQVSQWLTTWNAANSEYFSSQGLAPVDCDAILEHYVLARQPLLLLMLAIYDSDGNALQREGQFLQTGVLYERLLEKFLAREVDKLYPGASMKERRAEVEAKLHELGIIAFGMFNRGSQMISESEIEQDYKDLGLTLLDSTNSPSRTELPFAPLDRIIGHFFFIYESQAKLGSRGTIRRTYEFLHATFGEYLVTRVAAIELLRLCEMDKASMAYTTLIDDNRTDDELLFSLISFEPLVVRAQVLEFMKDHVGEMLSSATADIVTLLDRLIVRVTRKSRDEARYRYRPRDRDLITRIAVYSANLVTLRVLISGRPLVLANLPLAASIDRRQWWRSLSRLWQSQLEASAGQALTEFLDVTENSSGDISVGMLGAPHSSGGSAPSNLQLLASWARVTLDTEVRLATEFTTSLVRGFDLVDSVLDPTTELSMVAHEFRGADDVLGAVISSLNLEEIASRDPGLLLRLVVLASRIEATEPLASIASRLAQLLGDEALGRLPFSDVSAVMDCLYDCNYAEEAISFLYAWREVSENYAEADELLEEIGLEAIDLDEE